MFNIIGIDPGNNVGITIMTIDEYTFDIVNIETKTLILSNLAGESLIDRCILLNKIMLNIMYEYQPYMISMESSFLNMRFPKAVLQLSQYINSVLLAINEWNKYCVVRNYPPKLVKRYIGAGGNADKNQMLLTISKIDEITKHIDVNNITEHEIDSLAICYLLLKEIKDNPLIGYITN